jgi:predicted PurR-regulated permease PerM
MTSDSPAARAIRVTVVAFFLALIVWKTLSVDLLVFAGIVFAVFLSKSSHLVARLVGWRYRICLALVAAAVAILVAGLIWFLAHSVASQFDELSNLLTQDVGQLRQKLPSSIASRLPENIGAAQLSSTFHALLGIFSSAVGVIAAVVVVIFFGIYLAAEPDLYERGFIRLIPPHRRHRIAALLGHLGDVLWGWMLGRMFSMTIIGLTVMAGLWVLDVPVPLALGVLAAALAFVPYLGAIASAIPSLLLALALDVWHALYVLLLYIAVHILEGYILVPLVQRRAAHVPPALTLAGQLIMGLFAGILGLVLAMPLIAILIPTIQALDVEDVLQDRPEAAPIRARERPATRRGPGAS